MLYISLVIVIGRILTPFSVAIADYPFRRGLTKGHTYMIVSPTSTHRAVILVCTFCLLFVDTESEETRALLPDGYCSSHSWYSVLFGVGRTSLSMSSSTDIQLLL